MGEVYSDSLGIPAFFDIMKILKQNTISETECLESVCLCTHLSVCVCQKLSKNNLTNNFTWEVWNFIIREKSIMNAWILRITYFSNFTTLSPQLVDLGLSDVSALLSFLQLVLNLPQPWNVSIGLLLLQWDKTMELTVIKTEATENKWQTHKQQSI